jgi:hypothetical protein
VANPSYLATLARRGRGGSAVLAPPPIRGRADRGRVALDAARMSREPSAPWEAAVDPRAGEASSPMVDAASGAGEDAIALIAPGSLEPSPLEPRARGGRPAAREFAADRAGGGGAAELGADRAVRGGDPVAELAADRAGHGAAADRAVRGLAADRAARGAAGKLVADRAARGADPIAAAVRLGTAPTVRLEAGHAQPGAAAAQPVSPTAALAAAVRWVAGSPASRPDGRGDPVIAAVAPMTRRSSTATGAVPALDHKPGLRVLHIGSIEVAIQPPPAAAPPPVEPAARRAAATPNAPLARGFFSSLGLRQG